MDNFLEAFELALDNHLNFVCRECLCFCVVHITNVSSSPSFIFVLEGSEETVYWQRFNILHCTFRPTFRRIVRNKSTEQFSGLPYIYGLLNCLICLWYGLPIICPGIILVATVNSIGAMFQLIYITTFITFAENVKKVGFSS